MEQEIRKYKKVNVVEDVDYTTLKCKNKTLQECFNDFSFLLDSIVKGFQSWEFEINGAKIEKVIFNDPATIVIWSDGEKTVVKCQNGDTYTPEVGLAMCIIKKYCGNKGNYNNIFKKWIDKGINKNADGEENKKRGTK